MYSKITLDESKCVGCNKCIRNCLVMDANIAYSTEDGSNKVKVDNDKCVLCGKCIEVCDHDARDFTDDTERFFEDLQRGKKISVIAAPAVRANFDNYENLFGFLKARGVHMIYDVSFGADITTWAYLKAIRENNLKTVVAQPCPVIVSYVEKYKPSLISRLSPIHSPMTCTAVYLKKYAAVDGEIAFLSPCIGKTTEINDPNTFGYISYNVTFKKLKEYMDNNHINVYGYPAVKFEDIGCSLGAIYSRPGGLRENVEVKVKGAWVRQVEGHEHAYKYLDEYESRLNLNKPVPLLVDILNCSHGCNIGTATTKEIHVDDADNKFNTIKQQKLDEKATLFKKKFDWIFKYFDKNLNLNDFARKYNVSNTVKKAVEPSEKEYEHIFSQMHKLVEKDKNLNCSACGYGTCKKMAMAIHNEINYISNCADYNKKLVILEKTNIEIKNKELETQSEETIKMLDEVNRLSNERLKSSEKITEIIKNIAKTSEVAFKNTEEVNTLFKQIFDSTTNVSTFAKDVSLSVGSVVHAMKEINISLNEISSNSGRSKKITEDAEKKTIDTNKIIEKLSDSSKEIVKIVSVIDDIADQTNMLALNAAIEAAGAGEAGKGFAVVAGEVKELAKQTAESTDEIASQISNMQNNMSSAVYAMETIYNVISEITIITNTIAAAVSEQSAVSGEISSSIVSAAEKINLITDKVGDIAEKVNTASKSISEVHSSVKELCAAAAEVNY